MMNFNGDNRFEEVLESSYVDNDCGYEQDRDCGCGDQGENHGRCGGTRKEYLGKSITETKYFRVKTKRFIPSENNCCCGGCR